MHKRLGRAARALAEIFVAKAGGQLALRLWTGDLITPPVPASCQLEVTIKSAAAMRQMILHPGIASLAQLYAAGEIDVGAINPLAMVNSFDHTRLAGKFGWADKFRIIKAAWPLIAGAGKLTDPLAYGSSQAATAAAGRDDQSLVHFHYDLSNRFYELFLDPEMVYSCAYFENDDATLDEAQISKLELICRKLRLAPGQALFDPGCGWGGLICYAAKNYGVHAHGVTLAKEQFEYAAAKIARLGLGGQVKIELRDCRSVTTPESYDRIAQIEMFEHLGLDNHEAHFKHMWLLLKPRGLYLHQASTRRPTNNLADFRKKTIYQRFATRYIFPGGELDYIGMTVTNLERLGFEVHDVENMREHFQKTCEAWANRLWDNREAAARQVGEARTRMWLAYLSATVVAFRRSNLNLFQTLASKRQLGASGLPLSRRSLYEAKASVTK